MKKLWLLVVSITVTAIPSSAAMNFYRAANGQIVLEATDCQSAMHLINLAGVPDDPPGGQEDPSAVAEEDTGTGDDPSTGEAQDGIPGVKTIIEALVGPDKELESQRETSSTATEDPSSFGDRQEYLLAFVRDVNWKTKLHITWRDYSFFRRLKMACSGVSQLTKPMRISLESYTGSLDSTIDSLVDEGIDELAQAALSHDFSAMSKLSLVGMVDAVDKVNPFLLLAIDEETYNQMVKREPKIATLFDDLYTFFKSRAVLMSNMYDTNVKSLIRISQIGKGDFFNTWHVLAEYAEKMVKLDRDGQLTPSKEKEIHLWRLESSMHYIKEQVKVEQRAAELAVKDPQNADLVEQVKQGPKKVPTLDEKARALLRKSTKEEIKRLIEKYIAD